MDTKELLTKIIDGKFSNLELICYFYETYSINRILYTSDEAKIISYIFALLQDDLFFNLKFTIAHSKNYDLTETYCAIDFYMFLKNNSIVDYLCCFIELDKN